MKKFIDCNSRDKINNEIIKTLCQYCALPESDDLFLSRLMRTLSLINRLRLLDEHYDELLKIKDNMLKAGQELRDSNVIKFSTALNSAIDIISNHQNGRDDLLHLLFIAAQQLKDKINQFNEKTPPNKPGENFSITNNNYP
jgi:hypothetical protein